MTDYQSIGEIASRTLLLPIAPHLLHEEELQAVNGSIIGWNVLLGELYPDIQRWTDKYGGIFDSFLKVKLQEWFSGWLKPADHYVIHAPREANGQWFRVFRTTMFVEDQIRQAESDLKSLSTEQLIKMYSSYLGSGSIERCDSFKEWWEATLEAIRMGSWHIAVYSPKYQAFVSVLHNFDRTESLNVAEMNYSARLKLEFPPPIIQLYPGNFDRQNVWNLAELISSGAYIELFGKRLSAPPFCENWGTGVRYSRPGLCSNRIICGIIHRRGDLIQAIPVKDAPELDAVLIDAPNPFFLLQDIYAVTRWRPPNIPAEALRLDNTEHFIEGYSEAIFGENKNRVLAIQRDYFLDAIMMNPNITPVFGRIISTILPNQ